MASKESTAARIIEIESAMLAPDFWSNKDKAQSLIKELQDLKVELDGAEKHD